VPVLPCPDEMVAMMKSCVTTLAVGHSLQPRKSETSRLAGGLTFPRLQAIERVER
jgi:hypothetical protein